MCYHTSVKTTAAQLRAIYNNKPFENEELVKAYYHANGFAHPDLPIVTKDEIKLSKWGFIPFWAKDEASAKKLWNSTLNAKSETVFDLASFKTSIVNKRCIVPVTGFFEWKHVEKEKVPYYIHPKEHPYFHLGGIYSVWKDKVTNTTLHTFSILTTEANVFMADIHNSAKRMPLQIDERNIDAWLSDDLPKAGIIELMNLCNDGHMAAHKISTILSSKTIDSNIPEILEPIE